MKPEDLLRLALDHARALEDTLVLARDALPPDLQVSGMLRWGAKSSTISALHSVVRAQQEVEEALRLHEKRTKAETSAQGELEVP